MNLTQICARLRALKNEEHAPGKTYRLVINGRNDYTAYFSNENLKHPRTYSYRFFSYNTEEQNNHYLELLELYLKE